MPGTASQAIRVQGTKLRIYDDSGLNPVAITEIVEFSEQKSREMLDATHMDSPDDYREKLPSLKNAGQISFSVHLVPGDTTHTQLEADFEAATKRKFGILLPAQAGGTERTFNAYVQSVSKPYKFDDIFRCDFVLDVTGKVG